MKKLSRIKLQNALAMELVGHFEIKNFGWSEISDHLSISNRMKLFIFFVFLKSTLTYAYSISMKVEPVFKKDNSEVLESAFLRLVYTVDQQALKSVLLL